MTSEHSTPVTRTWRLLTEAAQDPQVAAADKVAIASALLEEDALMRTAVLIAGKDRAPAWYVEHGGRFRFGENDQLVIEVPVRPFILAM